MKVLIAGVLTTLGLMQPASAQIVIGQTAGFTGSAAGPVEEMSLGAKLVIDSVNAKGGVNGEKIVLISLDDGFNAERAAANTEVLIKDKKAIAIFLSRGTPTAEAMLPILNRHNVPLIAPSTGAMSLHQPVQRAVFNLRSPYQHESRKTIEQICTMAMCDNFAVIAVDDSFGDDALKGAEQAWKKAGAEPIFISRFDRATNNIKPAMELVKKHNPKAVLVIGAVKPSAKAVKEIRASVRGTYIATLSTTASASFVKELGDEKADVMVAQVFPRNTALSLPLVSDGRRLLKAAGKEATELTPAMIEGMAAARLLVSALSKTPTPVTSKKLAATLESGTSFDIGWPQYDVKYTPNNHSGISYIDLSRIKHDGRFQH